MTPIAERNFVVTIQGIPLQLTFLDGEDGAAQWVRTRIFVLERDDPALPARLPADPPVLTPAERRDRVEHRLSTIPVDGRLRVP